MDNKTFMSDLMHEAMSELEKNAPTFVSTVQTEKRQYVITTGPFSDYPFEGTLDEAKVYADSLITKSEYYTKDIVISIKNGKTLLRRPWNLVGMKPFVVPAGCIRLFDGYYGPWEKA